MPKTPATIFFSENASLSGSGVDGGGGSEWISDIGYLLSFNRKIDAVLWCGDLQSMMFLWLTTGLRGWNPCFWFATGASTDKRF
jgi:hypothetical protein